MWICLDCGERLDELGSCPSCKSENVDFTARCKECGGIGGLEQIARYGLCADCEIETEREFKLMLGKFSRAQLELLSDQYDGRFLYE